MATNTPGNGKTHESDERADLLAAQLKKLSSEIQARNARAADEVKAAVRTLADELDQAADNLKNHAPALRTLRDEAAVQGHLALLDAKDKLTLIEDLVRRAMHGAAQSPTFIGETAKLKLALARMDASDLLEEKRRALEQERRKLRAMTDTALKDLDDRLSSLAADKPK